MSTIIIYHRVIWCLWLCYLLPHRFVWLNFVQIVLIPLHTARATEKGSKHQKLNRENGHKNMYCITYVICVCNKRYAHFWSHSFRLPSQKEESQLMLFFHFKDKPFYILALLTLPNLRCKVPKPIKSDTVCVQCWKVMFLPSSQFLTLNLSYKNQMSTI
jgi:hypothetical protein